MKEMTDIQKQFCRDVTKAMETWNEHHPNYKMDETLQKKQQDAISIYKAGGDNPDNELTYYRSMNKILRELSGIGIKEPPGTGDPIADFERAMKIIS